ncbi:response regulator transcription factor [Bowmanella sp. Y26]|uniref:response regulator transcription factor n=1 Tax=Bowmanella yangjiangensis TaxID=2811230 RepID=UPI001BDCD97B|nr:response regulator transcription factor [Bowmanella yangjiangensis]MBT1062179.1 response regulator transcription factor [Bowmanella yangjiangensis]
MSIRVLLVDDQTLVREGVKSLLSLSANLLVVGEASDGDQVCQAVSAQQPDVILMDIRMPRMSGVDALRAMQKVGLTQPVIMLTTFDDHKLVLDAVQAGAKGYLLKDVSLETLVDAIETVHAGHTLIQPAVTEKILQGLQGLQQNFESYETPEPLTEAECKILRLMAGGCSNREIAEALFKSEGTIKNQVSSLLAKLGVRDRTRAVLKAIEAGLI